MSLTNATRFHFSYMHERGDQVSLTAAITRRSPLAMMRLCVVFILTLLIFLFLASGLPLAAFFQRLQSASKRFFEPALVGMAVVFCMPLLRMIVAAAFFKPSDRVAVTLDIDEHGIVSTRGRGLQWRVDWATVSGLIETRNHCFFRVSRNTAFILPRRAGSEQQYEQAIAFAKSCLGLPTESL